MSNFFEIHAVVVFSSQQNSLYYSSTVENDKKKLPELYIKKKGFDRNSCCYYVFSAPCKNGCRNE